MKVILGIDPGKQSGWAIFEVTDLTAVAAGEFEGDDLFPDAMPQEARNYHHVVVEVPVGQGPTYPDVVRTGVVAGKLIERFDAEEIERLAVRRRLTHAIHNVFRVTNDTTAWRAVKLILHGSEDADRRGSKKDKRPPGPLAHIKGKDARAALAAAVAWTLPDVPGETK